MGFLDQAFQHLVFLAYGSKGNDPCIFFLFV